MKKLSKIALLVLAVCILVCGFVFASSAEEANTTDPFIVNGKYYSEWNNALAAVRAVPAGENPTVYLNPNYEGEYGKGVINNATGWSTDVDLTLDMNGCTMRSGRETGAILGCNNPVTLTVTGEGKFTNIGALFSAETGKNGNIVINGLGKGITIETRSFEEAQKKDTNGDGVADRVNEHPSAGTIQKLVNFYGDTFTLSGKITIKPYNAGGTLFYMAGNNFNVVGADIVVENPASELQKYAAVKLNTSGNPVYASATTFIEVASACNIKVLDSDIVVNYGDMFKFSKYGNGNTLSETLYVYTVAVENAKNNGGLAGNFVDDMSQKTAKNPEIFIDADNSSFIAQSGNYLDLTEFTAAPNVYVGRLLPLVGNPVYATFDNCDLVGATRAITGHNDQWRPDQSKNQLAGSVETKDGGSVETTVAKSALTHGHLIFNNCNYTTADDCIQGSPWFIGEYANVKWNGGIIDAKYLKSFDTTTHTTTMAGYASCIAYNHSYGTLGDNNNGYDDDWYGAIFSNVYFVTNPNPTVGAAGRAATFSGTKYTNVDVILDSDNYNSTTVRYPSAWLDAPYQYVPDYINSDVLSNRTTTFNPTATQNNTSISVNTGYGKALSSSIKDASGKYFASLVSGKDDHLGNGNGYVKLQLGAGESISGGYSEIQMNGYAMIQGYDNTKNKSGDTTFKTVGEAYYYAAFDGKYSSAKEAFEDSFDAETGGDQTVHNTTYMVQEFDIATNSGAYLSAVFQSINRGASVTYTAANGTTPEYYTVKATNTVGNNNYFSILPDGTIKSGSDATITSKLPTDGSWTRVTIIYDIDKQFKKDAITLNGDKYNAYNFSGTKMYIYLDGVYFTTISGVKDHNVMEAFVETFTLDTIRISHSAPYNAGSLCLDNFYHANYYADDTAANAALAALIETKSNLTKDGYVLNMPGNNYVAYVDGVGYDNFDSAFANVKNGSVVELLKNYSGIIDVNAQFTIKTNGKTYGGFRSQGYVPTEVEGNIVFVPAMKYQTYKISYVESAFGINAEVNATVGSVVNVADSADPDKYIDAVNGKYLGGWSLEADKEAFVVTPAYDADKDGVVSAYPVYILAAVVEWYDANGNLLKTENYKPGAGVYAEEYLPEIANVVTNHNWYDLTFSGYEATELVAPGTYKLNPVMSGVAKDGAPTDVKINLTLYTNNELNIFVPLAELAKCVEDYATNIRIVRLDGNNEIAVGSTGECTVYGQPYLKFGEKYGIADTAIYTYKIYYKIGDSTLSKTITYGVPYYASQVMQTSDNETAKTLVINMVNYASSVIKNLNVDKTGDVGAQVYAKLLEKFPSYVRTYADADFLKDGTIYENEISKLNYNTVREDDPATENVDESLYSPSKWIESAGFYFSTNQPRFYAVLSEDAENSRNGIKKPGNNSGTYGFAGTGVFSYIAMYGEKERPGKLYARYDDTGADAFVDWNNKDKEITYYLVATMFDAQNPYKLSNMAENLSIIIYNTDGKTGNDVTTYEGHDTHITYSLSAYIYEMITAANAEGVSDADKAEYLAGAEMAKALYAYAKVAREYVNN